MIYFDDMCDKYGFGDGNAVPSCADLSRQVYVTALNTLAERHQSKNRIIAYNRPGVHNYCMVVVVPLWFFTTLTSEQVAGDVTVDLPLSSGEDAAWGDVLEEADSLNLDSYVIITAHLSTDYEAKMVELRETGTIANVPE